MVMKYLIKIDEFLGSLLAVRHNWRETSHYPKWIKRKLRRTNFETPWNGLKQTAHFKGKKYRYKYVLIGTGGQGQSVEHLYKRRRHGK